MKTKTSNKFNILLIAVTILLVFVACFTSFGKTGSWLSDNEDVGFEITVGSINVEIRQQTIKKVEGVDTVVENRLIENTGYIALGTQILEANTDYLKLSDEAAVEYVYADDITITNKEQGDGYYIRFQAIAMVAGEAYNLNSCITGDFYSHTDNWLYNSDISTKDTNNSTYLPMEANQTLVLIESINFPTAFIDKVQGEMVKLYLFIEGNATGEF